MYVIYQDLDIEKSLSLGTPQPSCWCSLTFIHINRNMWCFIFLFPVLHCAVQSLSFLLRRPPHYIIACRSFFLHYSYSLYTFLYNFYIYYSWHFVFVTFYDGFINSLTYLSDTNVYRYCL